MGSIRGRVTIARKPDQVFAYLDDFTRRKEWQVDVVATTVLTEGPTRLGTEVEETRRLGSRTITGRWRVTEYQPPQRSAFETYKSSMLRPSGVITTAPSSNDGTLVTFEIQPNPMGITKLMMPAIIRYIRKSIAADLDMLKLKLEST